MQGLIALYVGFFIYLIFFFCYKKKDKMAKKITVFLAIKLIFLSILYFAFFAQKPSKEERQKNIEKILIN